MKTVYLAVHLRDDDFDQAMERMATPDSTLIRQLEMVVQSFFGDSLVTPMRDGVILRVAEAQTSEQALTLLDEILKLSPGALANPPSPEDVATALDAIRGCLRIIVEGNGG